MNIEIGLVEERDRGVAGTGWKFVPVSEKVTMLVLMPLPASSW